MHELTVTQEILKAAVDKATSVGAGRVTRISLRIGEWSTIDPNCVDAYFGLIARGTIAECAELSVESVPAVFRCGSCGTDYPPRGDGFACPSCGAAAGELTSGRELYVESIEVQGASGIAEENPRGE